MSTINIENCDILLQSLVGKYKTTTPSPYRPSNSGSVIILSPRPPQESVLHEIHPLAVCGNSALQPHNHNIIVPIDENCDPQLYLVHCTPLDPSSSQRQNINNVDNNNNNKINDSNTSMDMKKQGISIQKEQFITSVKKSKSDRVLQYLSQGNTANSSSRQSISKYASAELVSDDKRVIEQKQTTCTATVFQDRSHDSSAVDLQEAKIHSQQPIPIVNHDFGICKEQPPNNSLDMLTAEDFAALEAMEMCALQNLADKQARNATAAHARGNENLRTTEGMKTPYPNKGLERVRESSQNLTTTTTTDDIVKQRTSRDGIQCRRFIALDVLEHFPRDGGRYKEVRCFETSSKDIMEQCSIECRGEW